MNNKEKDLNSDWLADQWDERSVLRHARVNNGRMKGDDPQIDIAQTPKALRLASGSSGENPKTFADSIPNNFGIKKFLQIL